MPFAAKSPFAATLFARALPLLALIAVIVHHIWFIEGRAVNIPYQDDIYDYLQFVNLVEAATTSADVLTEWSRQYVDHRTTASRLVVYGAYLAEGEVNFRTLTILANLALPLILLVFYPAVGGVQHRWVYLLIAALLLLNLRSPTISLASQPSFAYYGVFLYAFACLFALHEVTWPRFALAAVACTLATYTFASGQVVWLFGLASLFHQYWVGGRKPLAYCVAWLVLAVAVLLLWRIGFADVSQQLNLALLPDQLIDPPPPLSQAVARYTSWFLVILGCAFVDSSTLGASIVGVVMLALLVFISLRCLKAGDLRLALCGWFVVANAAAVSVGRAMWLSPEYILHERYSFFSVLLTCILTLLVLLQFRSIKTPVLCLLVALAGAYWAWTYSHFESRAQALMNGRYSEFNQGLYPILGKSLRESTDVVAAAIAAGIYHPPCRPFPACETSPPSER